MTASQGLSDRGMEGWAMRKCEGVGDGWFLGW